MSQTLAYVGWNGRGNTGDDAIFQALEEGLAPARVRTLPVYATELVRALATGSPTVFRDAHLLLGGGTLVGRSVWRNTLRLKAFPLVRRRPAFMVGVGVEDPSFQGRHSFSDGGRELRRWPGLLRRFARVTVRGPGSQALLAEVGVAADVVGDPALLLTPPAPVRRPPGKVVGVTLGAVDDLWGHDRHRVAVEIVRCLRALMADGWRVRLLGLNDGDAPVHAAVASALGGDGEQVGVETATTPRQYLQAAAGCTVVVAERLHAMVLAAAAGTPFVAVEYQPKCRDFSASVGWERWTVRTDSITGDALGQCVEDLAPQGNPGAAAIRLRSSVDVLRRRLDAEIGHIRRAMAGAA